MHSGEAGPDRERTIAIVGTGDHARVILDLVSALGMRGQAQFVEPTGTPGPGATLEGRPIVGDLEDAVEWSGPSPQFVVALGDNRARASAFARCLALGCRPVAVVHPTATLLGGAQVGPGAQVCAGAIVGTGTTIGMNVILNTAATLDHDDILADHVFVAPGVHLAGRVIVGEGAQIGIGAVARQGITVGAWSLVAAGAVVVSDVPPGWRVAGVPARRMHEAKDPGTGS